MGSSYVRWRCMMKALNGCDPARVATCLSSYLTFRTCLADYMYIFRSDWLDIVCIHCLGWQATSELYGCELWNNTLSSNKESSTTHISTLHLWELVYWFQPVHQSAFLPVRLSVPPHVHDFVHLYCKK